MTQIKNLNFIKMCVIAIVLLCIPSPKILPAYANMSSSQVTVIASELNVREAADNSSKIIGLAHRGDTFEIIQTKNNWVQIKRSDNRSGWVYSAYLTSTENRTATVEAPVLNVRELPNLSSKVVGKLKMGAKITVTEEQTGWAKIVSSSGVQGWVSTYYITKDTASNQQNQMNSSPTKKGADPSQTTDKKRSTQEKSSPISSDVPTTGQAISTGLAQQSQESLKGKTIVLDPGHGGMDAGTTSITGTHEKDLNLATAKLVGQKLENAGANVMITRTSDAYISLKQRTDLANQSKTDAFISFHYNWSDDPTVNGLTDFYYNKSKDYTLASDILNEVVKTTGLNNVKTKFDDLYVLRNNSKPSVLIELGFLSNKQDDSVVESSSYNDEVAQGVYLGLLNYFSSKN